MSKYNDQLSELIHLIHAFSSVRRYSNKSLIKDENIAEHSSLVGIITTFLYDVLSDHEIKSSLNIDKMLAYTIYHDLDEIFTGDVLNPVKYYKPEIKSGMDEYADECINKFTEVSGISSILRYTNKNLLNTTEQWIVKLADILSVFIKFRIENQLGNRMLNIDYKNVSNALHNHMNKHPIMSTTNIYDYVLEVIEQCSKLDSRKPSLTNILSKTINH